jgi:hypothetical protein
MALPLTMGQRNISPQYRQAMMQQQQQSEPSWWDRFKSGAGNFFQGVKEFNLGTPAGWEQVQNFTPDQINILNQLLQGGFNQTQNPTQGFQPIAQEAQRQFAQEVVPGLAERFTSMGGYGTGALSSPAFAGQLGSAGAGLQSMLAAQQAQYGQRNQQLGLQQAALGLQPQFQNSYVPATGGLVGGLFDLAKGIAPSAAYGYAAGAGGAPLAAGGQLINQLFRNR